VARTEQQMGGGGENLYTEGKQGGRGRSLAKKKKIFLKKIGEKGEEEKREDSDRVRDKGGREQKKRWSGRRVGKGEGKRRRWVEIGRRKGAEGSGGEIIGMFLVRRRRLIGGTKKRETFTERVRQGSKIISSPLKRTCMGRE